MAVELERVVITGTAIRAARGGGAGALPSAGGIGIYSLEPTLRFDEDVDVAANRKQAGCRREASIMAAVRSAAESGENPGTRVEATLAGRISEGVISSLFQFFLRDITAYLSGGVKDENYQSPEWSKMSVVLQGNDYMGVAAAQSGVGVPFYIEIHYWYNQNTRTVEQMKLKNTMEQGCAGETTSVG